MAKMVAYTLQRSRRHSVAIYITKDAQVEVRAPLRTAQADIDRFVLSKEAWISGHLKQRLYDNQRKASFCLEPGDLLQLRGREYPLQVGKQVKPHFDGSCFWLPETLDKAGRKQAATEIYKQQARELLAKRVAFFAARMGVSPLALKVNSAKTRWGSCSGKNSLNFSWRLLLACDEEIDYVVVHELAHIKHPNHSPQFWQTVAQILPDYALRQQRLKPVQQKLSGEDWD